MKLQKNVPQKSIGRQTSLIGKPNQKNDENDRQACNIRKFTQHRGSKPQNNKGTPDSTQQAKRSQQPALKPRNTNIHEIKQLNLTLDAKSRNPKNTIHDTEKKGTKFIAIQQNLDQLSLILQVQKKNIETQQDVSFGYQEEEQQKQISSIPKPSLEIKTEASHQLAQILKKQLNLNSTKEKRIIEIPKFLYGFTCENKNNQTVTNITPTSIKGNVCLLEKRVGGDYFRFDFKNQKQQQIQQVLEQSNKKIPENQPQIIVPKIETDLMNDPLIDDKLMEIQAGKDLCEQISFLNNFTDSNQSEDYSKTERFKEQFKVGNRVGQGAYATVRVAVHLSTGKKVAIKIYEKVKLKDHSRRKGVRREIKLLQKIDHPNIVKILDTIESNNHINIILEYVGGCSLHQYLKKQTDRRISEDICRPLFVQITQSIEYLHSLSICHRDIKLENILLDETFLIPKLIDFGFSTCFSLEKKVKMFCGTPSYMAPEITSRQEYRGDKSDIWALGVVLFALLQGYFPFKGIHRQTDQDLYRRIQSGEIIFSNIISDSAKNLINEMLKVDAETRISAKDILSHEWITGGIQKINRINHLSEMNLEIDFRDYQNQMTKADRKAKSLGKQQMDEFAKNISYITPTSNNKQFQFDFTSSSQPKVHSSYLQSQIMKKSRQGYSPLFQSKAIMPQHDLKIGSQQQLIINRMPNTSMTTTNANLQQRIEKQNNGSINDENARQFGRCAQQTVERKLSRTQQDSRQKTFSYFLNQTDEDVQLNQNLTKPSFDSDVLQSLSRRGYSPQQIKMRFYDLNSDVAELYHKIQLEKKKHMLTIYPSYIPSDKSICSIRSPSHDLNKSKLKERSRVLSQPKQNAFFDDDTIKNLHIYE